MSWPRDIRVGHTSPKSGRKAITLNDVELSPDEARAVATELQLRADFQDRTADTRLIDEVPRRVSVDRPAKAARLPGDYPDSHPCALCGNSKAAHTAYMMSHAYDPARAEPDHGCRRWAELTDQERLRACSPFRDSVAALLAREHVHHISLERDLAMLVARSVHEVVTCPETPVLSAPIRGFDHRSIGAGGGDEDGPERHQLTLCRLVQGVIDHLGERAECPLCELGQRGEDLGTEDAKHDAWCPLAGYELTVDLEALLDACRQLEAR